MLNPRTSMRKRMLLKRLALYFCAAVLLITLLIGGLSLLWTSVG